MKDLTTIQEKFVRENMGHQPRILIEQILVQADLMKIHPNTILDKVNKIHVAINKFIAEEL